VRHDFFKLQLLGTAMSPETAKLIGDLIPASSGLATIVGGIWIVITYIRGQRELAVTRLLESRKPFLELLLRLYNETAQVAGKLVSSDYGSPDWNKACYRFWELYWSELCVVEDGKVEGAMKALGKVLGKIANSGNKLALRDELEGATYALAHALRDGIIREWGAHTGAKMPLVAKPMNQAPAEQPLKAPP
jgi:hypothetical protein